MKQSLPLMKYLLLSALAAGVIASDTDTAADAGAAADDTATTASDAFTCLQYYKCTGTVCSTPVAETSIACESGKCWKTYSKILAEVVGVKYEQEETKGGCEAVDD